MARVLGWLLFAFGIQLCLICALSMRYNITVALASPTATPSSSLYTRNLVRVSRSAISVEVTRGVEQDRRAVPDTDVFLRNFSKLGFVVYHSIGPADVSGPGFPPYLSRIRVGGPLWPLAVGCVILPISFRTWLLLRARVRLRRGGCRSCGYDVGSWPATQCPECGAAVKDSRATEATRAM